MRSQERRAAPVMADVARLAGVSHQTVSRVVNGSPNIRPATRERVQRAIEQLGYRPNTAARALVTRRTDLVGVVSTNTSFFGPASITRTIEEAARDVGWFASTVSLRELTADELTAAIDHLLRQGVEAIVLVVGEEGALDVARSQQADVPMVVVEGDLSGRALTVGVDQVAGGRLATEHLLGLGHRHVVHVSGPLSWTEAQGRLTGYRQAMTAAGLVPAEPLVGDWSARSGHELGRRLAADDDVTAVFVGNDPMALGVLRALAEAGRAVPGQVSVVGFDDVPEAGYLTPPLTTVRQDFAEVGRRALAAVRAALTGDPPPEALVAPDLVVRASTARLRKGRR